MISMNSLGSNGRLGNQMFQYASLKGIARQNGYSFCIPKSAEVNAYYDHMLFKFFVMNGVSTAYGSGEMVEEQRGFRFDPNLFYACRDNVDIKGYLQSYRYFTHIRDEILSDFTFKKQYNIEKEYDVAIHVRRGDYVQKTEFHGLCSEKYYRDAMSLFPDDTRFVVLSDDIEWCTAQKFFSNCQFNLNDYDEDLYIMTNAPMGNIISNSSFSWWGAWLNQNAGRKVVAPLHWFNPNYIPVEETQDLIPDDWMRI